MLEFLVFFMHLRNNRKKIFRSLDNWWVNLQFYDGEENCENLLWCILLFEASHNTFHVHPLFHNLWTHWWCKKLFNPVFFSSCHAWGLYYMKPLQMNAPLKRQLLYPWQNVHRRHVQMVKEIYMYRRDFFFCLCFDAALPGLPVCY